GRIQGGVSCRGGGGLARPVDAPRPGEMGGGSRLGDGVGRESGGGRRCDGGGRDRHERMAGDARVSSGIRGAHRVHTPSLHFGSAFLRGKGGDQIYTIVRWRAAFWSCRSSVFRLRI